MSAPARVESLPPRQLEALRWMASGMTYRQAAREMGCSVSTVRAHLHAVFKKLGVAGQGQAVVEAHRRGWLNFPGASDEAVATTRLADVTERLIDALRGHRLRRLTPSQRSYLDAFDSMLAGEAGARAAMERALGPVLDEAGLEPSSARAQAGPLAEFVEVVGWGRDAGGDPTGARSPPTGS